MMAKPIKTLELHFLMIQVISCLALYKGLLAQRDFRSYYKETMMEVYGLMPRSKWNDKLVFRSIEIWYIN